MATTIAFTSCFDAEEDQTQDVWNRINEKKPNILLLLGDSIYMDFGVWPLSSRLLGWPRKASANEFAEVLYQRYRKQWSVESFRRLVASELKIGITWDDHDFAWNNSRGAGTEKKYSVPTEKRLISRNLFFQFKKVIQNGIADPDYPPMPNIEELKNGGPEIGIQESFDNGIARIIMLDGRSFRQDPNDVPDAEMHGRAQRSWLAEQLKSWEGIKVIGAGSVLTNSKESWDNYLDFQWLLDQPVEKVIVLTGDIHKNVAPIRHRDKPPLYEITSSGAARPGLGGNSGNFGILTINNDKNILVELFDGEKTEFSKVLKW
jgi:alkaline phosphatase D